MSARKQTKFDVFKRELLLAPTAVRVRLLENIEILLARLDPSRSFPYDFIFFSITGHRPEADGSALFSYSEISLHLARILDAVGRTVRVAADSIPENVLTVDDLAHRWRVSPATIFRWRSQGLPSRLLTFEKGRRKVAVRESLAIRFETDRSRLLLRALARRKLSLPERRAILEDALLGLARDEAPGRILSLLTERYNLPRTKVQRILATAARANPALRPLSRAGVSRRESASICDEVASGEPLAKVARLHGRSVENVKRVYLRGRARSILRRRMKFIPSDEFTAPSARAILKIPAVARDKTPDTAPADELPVYLKGIAGAPLLTREEEAALFRKYNYLKFRASRLREALDPRRPKPSLMDRIEDLLAEAGRVRERLIRSNLRLVASIARRHHGRKTDFSALLSDGNLALMDAVEGFDYSRGNRFSTYAGWAIMRRFARTVPEDSYSMASIDDQMLEETAVVEVDYTSLRPAAVAKRVADALAGLPERERVIIENRFGLGRSPKPCTLQEIGSRFGVTKERIRQIEAQALVRLKSIIKTTAPELAAL